VDIEHMIGSVIQGALTGKNKRRKGATRYLSGGKGSFLNASTLLAVAGVAWGLYETVANKGPVYAEGGAAPSGAPVSMAPNAAVPSGPAAGGVAPPPLPGTVPAAAPAPAAAGAPDVPEDVLRLVRLTISTARADGTLSPREESVILEHARAVGAEAIVQHELRSAFTLAQIAAGVTDATQREELYTLAFAIARGDEQVTGGERIYLAQLAYQLGLDAATAARLERQAVARIDAAAVEPDNGSRPA
jgi:uncharacterized membrane protein YebE (DUF533 family)